MRLNRWQNNGGYGCAGAGNRRNHRGSQRENVWILLPFLRMAEMGLNKEDYWWYRDFASLRSLYRIPALALGFERLIAYVTGVQNVRDVIPFPRTTQRQLLILRHTQGQLCWPAWSWTFSISK